MIFITNKKNFLPNYSGDNHQKFFNEKKIPLIGGFLILPLLFLIFPKKVNLYQQIDKRLNKMIDTGLLREVKKHYLQNLSLELPSMKAIGIKFFFEYLSGKRNFSNLGE